MKLGQGSLSVSRHLKSISHHCGGPVKLVQLYSRSLLTLKHELVRTSNGGENCFLNPFQQTGMNKLHKTCTLVKPASDIFPDTQTGLHELHKTSTVLKTAFYSFPTI